MQTNLTPMNVGNDLSAKRQVVLSAIASAALTYHRSTPSINLLAVSKMQSADSIRALFLAGQTSFGENYLQEALDKQSELSDLPIEWHFIGHLQSRKGKDVGRNFHWVHTIDRIEVAHKINAGAMERGHIINACIQVHLSDEETKNGVAPLAIEPLARAILMLSHIKLRGLMTIPAPVSADNYPDQNKRLAKQREPFQKLAECLAHLRQSLSADSKMKAHINHLDTLSMGMSDDFVAAIAEGATIVRMGTALFGARPLKT